MAGPAPRTWEDKAEDWVYVTLCLKLERKTSHAVVQASYSQHFGNESRRTGSQGSLLL